MIPLFKDKSLPVTWHVEAEDLEYSRLRSITEIHASVAGFAEFLLKHGSAREYSEVVALAFWFRRAHLAQIKVTMPRKSINKKIHRVFHVAPANVDTVFMYSVLLSVLCANRNIVRISQRSGEVTWLLISLLKQYLNLPEGQALASQIAIVEYDARHEKVTEQLSDWCDLRVIWGGDEAIKSVSAIAPKTAQVCFPDRYSIAILALDDTSNISEIARRMLADVLPFNQQACSSPKAIYWLNTPPNLQKYFWGEIEKQLVNAEHKLEISNKVEQQINFQYLAAAHGLMLDSDDEQDNKIFPRIRNIGMLSRCKVRHLNEEILASHSGNGLILEHDITTTEALAFSEKLQTIACAAAAHRLEIQGEYKRISQLGRSLVFDTVWDGIDLLEVFH